MILKFRIFAGVASAATVLLIALALQSSGNRANQPSLSGWMEKFTLAAAPAPSPALTFRDPAGGAYDLGKFSGRIVLINFWATWCGPCIREMPSLVRLQQRLGGKDFTILALSQDIKGFDVITPFVAKHKLGDLPVFHDPKGRSLLALKIPGLPTSVLFDREGRELGRLSGHAEWDSNEAVALIEFFLKRG
jgi:thiol-disulfide isomerase/thioredoxin